MNIESEILTRGLDIIPYHDFIELTDIIERYYHFSSCRFWMWKVFQFGYVYGKRAERARRKRGAAA